jgi:hypothetical protein
MRDLFVDELSSEESHAETPSAQRIWIEFSAGSAPLRGISPRLYLVMDC